MKEPQNIYLSTGVLPPVGAVELGLVRGLCCLSKNIVFDVTASLKNKTIGGELKGYTDLMAEGLDIALTRLREQAAAMGADGVYAIQIATPQVSAGAAEIIALGPAYRLCTSE